MIKTLLYEMIKTLFINNKYCKCLKCCGGGTCLPPLGYEPNMRLSHCRRDVKAKRKLTAVSSLSCLT